MLDVDNKIKSIRQRRTPWVLAGFLALTFVGGPVWAQAPTQQQDDDESSLLIAKAREQLDDKDFAGAGRTLDQVLELNPRRIDAYVLRASIHATNKDYRAGVALMRRAARLAPDDEDVLTTLGSQLMLLGEEREGVPILERVVDRRPSRYQAQLLLSYHYVNERQYARAAPAFEAYLSNRPAALANEDTIHRFGMAEAYLRSGEPKKALVNFRAVEAKQPRSIEAKMGVAWALAATDCRKALPTLTELMSHVDRHPNILLVRGHCDLELGNTERAAGSARRYLERSPNNASAYALLAEAAVSRRDYGAARTAIGRARELSPNRRGYGLLLARVERLDGNVDEAMMLLDEVRPAGQAPENDLAWSLEHIETLLAAGRNDQAIDEVEGVLVVHPQSAAAQELHGLGLFAMGDTDAAIAPLELALEKMPTSERGRNTLADALTITGTTQMSNREFRPASSRFARAAEVRPTAETLRNYGVSLLMLNDADKALSPLEAASQSGDALSLQLYGRALGQLNRNDEARSTLNRAMQASGDDGRRVEVALEMAALEFDTGNPVSAISVLEGVQTAAQSTKYGNQAKAALATARYVAGLTQLQAGQARPALRYLRDAERSASGRLRLQIRCHAALAATAAGQYQRAINYLRTMRGSRSACGFAEPFARVAVPLLTAVNEGMLPGGSRRALNRLDRLYRNSRGRSRDLVSRGIRTIAFKAAADAYSRGRIARAERYLQRAVAAEGARRPSPERQHNQAVLALARGNDPAAIAQLNALSETMPQSLVNLGVFYDRNGQPLKALEYYRRAVQRGIRYTPLRRWIEAKERVFLSRKGNNS